VSKFVTQYWVSMYYNSWNIRKATSHCFLDCSSDQGTIMKAKWQLSSKCPSSYSTLKTSIASQILTTTGATIPHDKQLIRQTIFRLKARIQASLEVFADARKTDYGVRRRKDYGVKRRKDEPGGNPNGLHIKDAGNIGCTSP